MCCLKKLQTGTSLFVLGETKEAPVSETKSFIPHIVLKKTLNLTFSISMETARNPNSIKTRFAFRFLRAIKKLGANSPRSVSMGEKNRRYLAIRAAAYASMAMAVGQRRAWSRALLKKIGKRRRSVARERVTAAPNPRNGFGFGSEKHLRDLVPGGKDMEFCRLLNEAGHYAKCLKAQVDVMKKILGSPSK